MLNESDIYALNTVQEHINQLTNDSSIKNVFSSFKNGFTVYHRNDIEVGATSIEKSDTKIFELIDDLVEMSLDDNESFLNDIKYLIDPYHRRHPATLLYRTGRRFHVNVLLRPLHSCMPPVYIAKLMYLCSLSAFSIEAFELEDLPIPVRNTRNFSVRADDSDRILHYICKEYLDLCVKNPLFKAVEDKIFEYRLSNYEEMIKKC